MNHFFEKDHSQPAKLQKTSVEECIFDYMTSHIKCKLNKNSLLQCYFLAILPAGLLVFYLPYYYVSFNVLFTFIFLELMFVLCWMLHPDVSFRAKLGDLVKYPWFTRDVDISNYDYDTVLSGKLLAWRPGVAV